MRSIPISFEFFPPQTPQGLTNLVSIAKELSVLNPSFFSVTFGAGGSTTLKTYEAVATLTGALKQVIAPHISCLHHSSAELLALLTQYQEADIRHLVVLRGDEVPENNRIEEPELKHASDLVSLIRQHFGDHFFIEVAAYPECHPESASLASEIHHFKRKVDAGANRAITQYFYNADAYYDFVDECIKAGISIPIVPGIMPITNYARLERFSNLCGAQIPKWLVNKLQSYGEDEQSLRQFGQAFVTEFCVKLLEYEAPGLHFYTLNQAEPALSIAQAL